MPFLRFTELVSGDSYEFHVTVVRIGRDPANDVTPAGAGSEVVSGRHCRFRFHDERWWLEDFGSRNGTFLQERRLAPGTPQPLSPGSVIRLGARGPQFRIEAVETQLEETLVEDPGATTPVRAIAADLLPEPPPDAPPKPEATVLLVEPQSGETYRLRGARIRIGRGKECEFQPVGPDDTSVSRVHAEIVLKPDGAIVIRDAQSRNGTFIGGTRLVGERELQPGNRIRLGLKGPELAVMDVVGPEPAPAAAGQQPKSAKGAASRAAEKLGAVRRSFGGKGATLFFHQLFQESSRRAARRIRWVAWSTVIVLTVAVGGLYWYKDRLERQLRSHVAAQRAAADSIREAAAAEYERLRVALAEARASSAPRVVVDSLRAALDDAEVRTAALEVALRRAEASLAQQLAAGDSLRRAAQVELGRLRSELERASATGTPQSLLDSLRVAVQEAEDRATAIASQLEAVRGGNLATVSQANQGAVGLITTHVGLEVFDGSGFAVAASGYFVTNRHVIQPHGHPRADSVFVTMADQRIMRAADIVGIIDEPGPDLALLRIRNHDGSHVPRVDWSGANVRQGDPAALIGFPAGFGNAIDATGTVRTTMTAGIFAKVTSETINFDGFTVGGSSGSPILNAKGEVVAIHRAGLREAAGLSFAVPIGKLLPLLPRAARTELGLP
jgi:pSer/pThr/pTyr-binding forkhead associated (FHA) protein/S1-C subfamily serine protease